MMPISWAKSLGFMLGITFTVSAQIVVLNPVEWDVGGEDVWPQKGIMPPLAIEKLAASAAGRQIKPLRTRPRTCFAEACAHQAATESGAVEALLLALIHEDSLVTAKLAVYDTVTHEVRAMRVTWKEGPAAARLETLRKATELLLLNQGDIESGPFSRIPWLRARPDVVGKPIARWAAPALGLVALTTALLEDQFSSGSAAIRPSQTLRPESGAYSFLPGLFAGFSPPTALAGRGSAGLASAIGSEAALISPAGIATTRHLELFMQRASLPDGTPEFQTAFVAPAGPGLAQGYSLRYRGDELAEEAVVAATWAMDLGWLHPTLIGMQVGSTAKLLLGEIGRGGTGIERSQGHSFGTSLDLGLRLRLMRSVLGAIVLEDVASYVWHSNDFTQETTEEIRPLRLMLGVSLRPTETLWLHVDGRKGLYADQGDAVEVGIERSVLKVLRLRTGLQEIFGRETVRKIGTGFGLRNDGFENLFGGRRLAVDYAFEFGLDEAGMLAGGHRFGLLAAF